MITTTLGALVDVTDALATLGKQSLPAKTAYQVGKMLRLVPVEVQHFEAQRQALIAELGETVGDQTRVPPANIPAFVTRIHEHLAVPVDLDVTPIALDSLGAISGADVRALLDAGLLTPGDAV